MLEASLVTYPWDLLDEGLETVLDRLQGEIGVTRLSVWGAAPPVMQLRARKVTPRFVRTRGGLLFQPAEEYYTGTRCKPMVSTWVKGRNPLSKIAQACAERGMALQVKVSAALMGRLAHRHPEMTCKNVFGGESELGICLANPDVQACLGGLIADLSQNYKLSGITLADFLITWPEALATDTWMTAGLGTIERWLLAMCFCESCYQRAAACGVDVDAVRRSAQVVLEGGLDRGQPMEQPLEDLLAQNAPLAAHQAWRAAELAALFQRLRDACGCELLLERGVEGEDALQQEGIDLKSVAGVVTRIDCFEQLPSALLRDARRSEVWLPASLALGRRGTGLVSAYQQAAELGFAGVEIGGFGQLPDAALSTIKQAIRIARRATTE